MLIGRFLSSRPRYFRQLSVCIVAVTMTSMMMTFNCSAAVFTGSTRAVFGTPTPPGVVYTIDNADPGETVSVFTHGNGAPFGSEPNTLTTTGLAFNNIAAESLFPVLGMNYYNGVTASGSNAEDVPVTLVVTLTDPILGDVPFGFSFHFILTPNTTGNPVLDADTLIPLGVFASETFFVGTTQYTLKLEGFSTDGGNTITTSMTLPENTDQNATLYASFTEDLGPNNSPVPLPTSLVIWSFGIGIAIRRYRSFWRNRHS